MIKTNYFKAILLVILIVLAWNMATAEEFPYRKKYPGLPTINTDVLYDKYTKGEIIIVDVRSVIEYNVIHPIDAIHIPISNMLFTKKVGEVIEKNPGKKLAFYCNGITCLKSYEATKKAISAGCKTCFAFDAGIPSWANSYPGKTLLLGETIVDPKKQIIPKSDFKKKCLAFKDFKSKANSPNVIVIDARDHIQRSDNLPGIKNTLSMPFDKLIPNFVKKKRKQDKLLLIFDQVGKQVRWLEYYLVENGYKNYFFLKGGATDILKKQTYK